MSTTDSRVRIAATGDLHVRGIPTSVYRDFFVDVSKRADVLLLCGDLTQLGSVAEAESLAADLGGCSIPVLGVLGNHDYQSGLAEEVRKILRSAKLILLDHETFEYQGV